MYWAWWQERTPQPTVNEGFRERFLLGVKTARSLGLKVVPWTDEDGKAFPKGQHVAFTHWRNDAAASKSYGVWQYCSEVSGEAVEDFMKDYPYSDSPEPNAA